MQFDHVEELTVVEVALGEAPRDHPVIIGLGSRPVVVDAVLEGVVKQRHESEPFPVLAVERKPVDVRQHLDDMRRDGSFGMSGSGFAPSGSLDPVRIAQEPGLDRGLRHDRRLR